MPTATVSAPVHTEDAVSGKKPVMVFRARGVSASVFANQGKSEGRDVTFYKVSPQRAYKEDGEWKHTTSFGRDDLPLLKKVVDDAWNYILDAEAKRGSDEAAA